VRAPEESAVDRIVQHLPGDRASRRTRARTLLRLAMALVVALIAGVVLWQFQATKDYASAAFASTAAVAVADVDHRHRLRLIDWADEASARGMTTTERRLTQLEGALSPTERVKRWLAEAHERGHGR